MELKELSQKYQHELLKNIVPFWEHHSIDWEYGGYFTCLDREGHVYDTDKFIWLQARQVWMFAKLYNEVEQNENWLKIAENGAGFLRKYGQDGQHNWYFSVTRLGRPLVQPYNIFSDCFAAMAFGQLYKATGNDAYASIAKNTFENILKRADQPKGIYNKRVPETRPLKGFSLPMILCNLCLELEHILEPTLVEKTIDACIHEVMDIFYQPDLGLILENVLSDGSFSDSFEGRLVNPGHGIEAMWFMMDLAARKEDAILMNKAVDITMRILEFGWDKEYGGVFYFLDCKGHPPQQLEWDQKLWWVHMETLISLIKGYHLTGRELCFQWFEQVHDYTWAHFPDPDFGEWFGYLNRKGEILLPLKGGKWKGCFHIPRGLYQIWQTVEKINSSQEQKTINDLV